MARRRPSIVATSMRLPRSLLRQVDSWAARQPQPATRSDVLRFLVEAGLKSVSTATKGKKSGKSIERAAGLAGRMIDRLGDKSATAADRAHRKLRLLKGPSEFRQMRADHAAKRKK